MKSIYTFLMFGVRLNLIRTKTYYSVVYNRVRVFSSDSLDQCKKVYDMIVRNLLFSPNVPLNKVLASCNNCLILEFHRNKNYKFCQI